MIRKKLDIFWPATFFYIWRPIVIPPGGLLTIGVPFLAPPGGLSTKKKEKEEKGTVRK
ncbi:MAG: hypothetical protein GTO45_10320 [Candidatus Aminicenantes bacterium]|nr:hypothetical protein [Candidatus Aminicenantes bacterium]NIM79204.1 hypothetical protein [Candidatus Aminicenantes bacterium]NIN18482.1 hypothetical protein [Candidatus Aminicenantes bacterium]NIN42378.1 hypothetical protein [Candidatus Aminicenantes bacterium]NIN85144.1 hypothetical protein [Candidatus Aminicenantes bacterium]